MVIFIVLVRIFLCMFVRVFIFLMKREFNVRNSVCVCVGFFFKFWISMLLEVFILSMFVKCIIFFDVNVGGFFL